MSDIIREMDLKGIKRHTELHWVQIHFNTPTFDKITSDEAVRMTGEEDEGARG